VAERSSEGGSGPRGSSSGSETEPGVGLS
jgi:hypothetical protein